MPAISVSYIEAYLQDGLQTEQSLFTNHSHWETFQNVYSVHSNVLLCFLFLSLHQASQLGVYRAFVDNYELAVETAEKCCQANTQFAEISEVRRREERVDRNPKQG